jgi:peptide/nickel transport system substrate-binding protein
LAERKERNEMSKKVLWVFLTLLTIMALIITSCQPQTSTEEEGETTVISGNISGTEAPPVITGSTTTSLEKPKYGGYITIGTTTDPTTFDDGCTVSPHVNTYTLNLTHDTLLQGDWTKGPAGTGETTFIHGSVNKMSLKTGAIADSWEIPSQGKIIFHIREGIHWQNKPPVNGRELTIDDVVATLVRDLTMKGNYINVSYPVLSAKAVVTSDVTARTVTVECPKEEWINLIALIPNYESIMPKDALELYNNNLNDWKKNIGTGPFLFSDYVSAGSMTFTRNPNFWEKNPIGPGKGDQLPYADGVKILIVPDTATYFAAMRVGKLDGVGGNYIDIKEFLSNPDISYTQTVPDGCYALFMRTDKADSPFSKLKVRQALHYATDFNRIINDYYEAHATLLNWPMSPIVENKGAYVPFNELPPETQALFSHDVTKAKALLTEAGYPTGLSIKILAYNSPSQTDFLSQIVQMWAEAGITVTIDAKDYVTYVTRGRNRNYEEMINYTTSPIWQRALSLRGTSQYNLSFVDDPVVNEYYNKAGEFFGLDDNALAANFKAIYPYVVSQCWVVPFPNSWYYVCWWPWVKNWHGELYVGYYSLYSYMKYRWQDVELKKQMVNK